MVKVHIHTRRIVFPFFLFSICILVLYMFFSGGRIDVRQRIILQASHLACVQPNLKVNSSDLQKYFVDNDPLTCDNEKDWVEVKGHQAVILDSAKQIHGNIECTITELLFKNDDTTTLGHSKTTHNSFEFTSSDFYSVTCKGDDGTRWTNTLAGIRNNMTIKMELSWQFVPSAAVKMNVLMLGFDSLSRTNFMRALPKTYRFLKKELKSNVLEGYNIVGDGTPQALIPILTGHTELELPETRKRMGDKAQFVDIYPFIWNDFKRNGYVTLFAEDQPNVGTFNYRLKGFSNPPTDHYMRIFFNNVFPTYKDHPQYCLRGTPRHKVFLNYIRNFFEVYKDKPKFAFAMHSELSHDDYNLVSVADEDILEFLKFFKEEKHSEDTFLILFSDHGNRFSSIRGTQQGKQEERLPFVSIYLPQKFKQLYPSAADNVRVNTERLSTPFDLYPTLKDLTQFSGAKLGKTSNRAISLFSEIPTSRTCGDAFIEPHWCACLTWEPIPPTNDKAIEAALDLVHYINTFTAPYRAYCHEVKLTSVLWAALLLPNQGFLKFKQTADYDGFLPDLSSNTAISEEVYQISITTIPTRGYFRTSSDLPTYEASLTYNIKQDSFSVKMEDVSRINKYGDQPHCIMYTQPQLRKFCYCLDPP